MKVRTRKTAAGRLRAVADIIETQPEVWRQDVWAELFEEGDGGSAEDVATLHTCGTYGCIAGWGVAMIPVEVDVPKDWELAGQLAFGIDRSAAEVLFDGHLDETASRKDIVRTLRWLASVPDPVRRTLTGDTVDAYLGEWK